MLEMRPDCERCGADLPADEGCAFRTRCPRARPDCALPPPEPSFGGGHAALCRYPLGEAVAA